MRLFSQFFKLEAASGIILLIMAVLALILCNSPLAPYYQKIWQVHIAIHIGHFKLDEPFLFWVNEGLMTLFFLIVGLELKYEFMQGELSNLKQVMLPLVAAMGGMLIPIMIYCLMNSHNPEAMAGWAVPVATDIAFAVGVLSLFGKRVPLGLKVFLLALAIFDDVGAIIIIAGFHSDSLSYVSLLMALFFIVLLLALNHQGVRRLSLYILVGLLLWLCVLKSGVHSTVAGVLLGFLIPLRKKGSEIEAPLTRLRHTLHPWVAYFVMPLFAFANAGVSFLDLSPGVLMSTVVMGIALGLFLGKQIGAFLFAWVMIRMGWAKLPANTSWLALYGVTIICGIGFTMSLFLGTLAFAESDPVFLTEVRLGVLLGSFLSGMTGALVLHIAFHPKALDRKEAA